MSTKLNTEELLRKRRQWSEQSSTCVSVTQDLIGYSDAIHEVAQPIADERDELLEALEWTPNGDNKHFNTSLLGMAVSALRNEGHMTLAAEIERMRENIRAILAKYQTQANNEHA